MAFAMQIMQFLPLSALSLCRSLSLSRSLSFFQLDPALCAQTPLPHPCDHSKGSPNMFPSSMPPTCETRKLAAAPGRPCSHSRRSLLALCASKQPHTRSSFYTVPFFADSLALVYCASFQTRSPLGLGVATRAHRWWLPGQLGCAGRKCCP